MANLVDLWHIRDKTTGKVMGRSARFGKGSQWQVTWSTYPNGKRERHRKAFTSPIEAARFRLARAEEEQDARAGRRSPNAREPHRITFKEVCDQFADDPIASRKAEVGRGTIPTVKGHMRWIGEHFGTTTLVTVANDQSLVRGFIAALRAENVGTDAKPKTRSDATVNRYLTTLGALYSYPYRWGWTTARLTAPDLPKFAEPVRKRGLVSLTAEQIDAVADNVPSKYRMLYRMLGKTGVRLSEARGLPRDCIDLDAARIYVWWQAHDDGTLEDLKNSENPLAYRMVPIRFEPLIDELREHLAATEHLAALRPDLNLVFPSERGTPLSSSNLHRRAWQKGRAGAGLPPQVDQHHFRRSYGSLLYADLQDIALVAELMGDDEQTVLRYYVTKLSDGEARTNAALNRIFGEQDVAPDATMLPPLIL